MNLSVEIFLKTRKNHDSSGDVGNQDILDSAYIMNCLPVQIIYYYKDNPNAVLQTSPRSKRCEYIDSFSRCGFYIEFYEDVVTNGNIINRRLFHGGRLIISELR